MFELPTENTDVGPIVSDDVSVLYQGNSSWTEDKDPSRETDTKEGGNKVGEVCEGQGNQET